MTLESNLTNKGAVGGLIYNLDSAERAIFDRKNVYLFGTCLAKMDLNCVLNLSDKVKLVTEPLELDELQKFKEKYGVRKSSFFLYSIISSPFYDVICRKTQAST